MNDTAPPDSSVDMPRGRLWLAVIALTAMLVMRQAKHLDTVFDTLLLVAYVPIGAWIAFNGVFKVPQLQLLWGWMCLAVGSVVVVLVLLALVRNGSMPNREPPVRMLLELGVMLLSGYLLVFDRRIRAYRCMLRARQSP